jgi:plastocyanin
VVDLYVDGTAAATGISADAMGHWQHVLTLADGTYDIHAVARMGALTSPPSPMVTLVVDSTLFWDPISLRFTDSDGHVIVPSGRLDETGWTVFLRPGHTYSVTLRVCCTDPNAQVTLDIGDINVTLTDADGDHTYTGVFTVPAAGRFTGVVRICVTCDLIRRCSDGQVTIDPEGTVFDLITGTAVEAATVSCMQANVGAAAGEASFVLWPAADFDQINPQTVAADGYFSFFTPQGTYRLNVTKSGYQSYVSPDLTVVDAPVHFDVPLTPVIAENASVQIAISDGGFEPAVLTVAPGAIVEWINTDGSLHSTTSITPAVVFEGPAAAAINADSGAWDSGLLGTGEVYKRQLNDVGVYTYADVANPDLTATIIVQESEDSLLLFLPQVVK